MGVESRARLGRAPGNDRGSGGIGRAGEGTCLRVQQHNPPAHARPLPGGPLHRPLAPPRPRAAPWIPAALAAAIVLLLWSPNLMRPPPPAWTPYVSTKGRIRRVILADKSVLRLNGASRAKVVFEDADRRVALGQAEAALTMTPSRARPFLISAGDREVRMDGGEVNILRQTSPSSASTILTVRRGLARIYPANQPGGTAMTAGPGDEIAWTDGQPALSRRRVNPANAFAWESRRLAYDHAPLAVVVADLNRYVARPIRLGDPSLAALPYTGVITLQGEGVMLRRIGAVLPVAPRPSAAQIVLVRRPVCPVRGCAKPRRPGLLAQSLFRLGKPRRAPAPPASPPPARPSPP